MRDNLTKEPKHILLGDAHTGTVVVYDLRDPFDPIIEEKDITAGELTVLAHTTCSGSFCADLEVLCEGGRASE